MRGYPWTWCRECSSGYVPSVVPSDVLADYYADYYGEGNLAVPHVVGERLRAEVRTFDPFRTTGRLLDVGYGAGTLLELAGEDGWECWGTEISTSADLAAAGRGWQLHVGDIDELDLPQGSFDVVCMVELLEHVPEPQRQLEAAARLLRPGGLLYATTPNARGVSGRLLRTRWSAVAPPEHLQLYSPGSLRRAARRAGFDTVSVRAQGTNPYELVSALKGRQMASHDRVESAYALNEQLHGTTRGRALREAVNSALRATSLGDSLRLRATTPVGAR